MVLRSSWWIALSFSSDSAGTLPHDHNRIQVFVTIHVYNTYTLHGRRRYNLFSLSLFFSSSLRVISSLVFLASLISRLLSLLSLISRLLSLLSLLSLSSLSSLSSHSPVSLLSSPHQRRTEAHTDGTPPLRRHGDVGEAGEPNDVRREYGEKGETNHG